MAFDTDFQCAVRLWSDNAEHYIAIVDLTVVERHLSPLVHLPVGQLCRTGNATTIFAAIGQIDALFPQRVQQKAIGINFIGGVIAIGDGYNWRRL